MKSALFCLLALLSCLLAVYAHPHLPTLQQQDVGDLEVEAFNAPGEGHGLRYRRATCDLLSFSSKWVTPNHAGCALHCIAKGYKGGKCKNTVCHCRR